MTSKRSATTNRIFLLVAGIVVAVFIALQTHADGNRQPTSEASANKMPPMISVPYIFSRSKEIIRVMMSLGQ